MAPNRLPSALVRILFSVTLLGAAGSFRLAAEPGPAIVRIANHSTAAWALQTSPTLMLMGFRRLPGPGGGVPPFTGRGYVAIPAGGWIEVAWPMGEGPDRMLVPLAPRNGDAGRGNPYSFRADFRRAPGSLSVQVTALRPTPTGYRSPFTVDGNTLSINRPGWKMPREAKSPAPAPPPLRLPPPALQEAAGGGPPRPNKRKAEAAPDEPAPAANHPRLDLPVPAPPALDPEAPRLVRISNRSRADWILELPQPPFSPSASLVWRKDRHQILRAVDLDSWGSKDGIDVTGPDRPYFKIRAGRSRYLMTPRGHDPLLIRLWDEVHGASPFAIALVLNNANPVPAYIIADDGTATPAFKASIERTLGFKEDRIILKTDGWDQDLVDANPPGTGLEASPSPRTRTRHTPSPVPPTH